MVGDMFMSRTVTAHTGDSGNQRAAIEAVHLFGIGGNPRHVTFHAADGHGASEVGSSIKIWTGAVHPGIAFGQVADVSLIKAIGVPPQITLTVISGTEDQIHWEGAREHRTSFRMLQYDLLDDCVVLLLHLELQFGSRGGEHIMAGLQAAQDGVCGGQHGGPGV